MPTNFPSQTFYSQALPKSYSHFTHAVPTRMFSSNAFIWYNSIAPSKFKSNIFFPSFSWPSSPWTEKKCFFFKSHWAIIIKLPLLEASSTLVHKPLFVSAHSFFYNIPQRHYINVIHLVSPAHQHMLSTLKEHNKCLDIELLISMESPDAYLWQLNNGRVRM